MRSLHLSNTALWRIFTTIVLFELLLAAAYLIEQASGQSSWNVQRLLDADGEQGFAVWFSSLQLALIGIVIALRLLHWDQGRDPARWFIVLLSLGLLTLSMDEHLQLHEEVSKWSRRTGVGDFWGGQGLLLTMFGTTALVLAAVSWRQILTLWNFQQRALLLVSGGLAIFFAGAIGLDLIAHLFLDHNTWLYTLEAAAEEFLEQLGGTVMLMGAIEFSLVSDRQTVNKTPRDAATAPLRSPTGTAPQEPVATPHE